MKQQRVYFCLSRFGIGVALIVSSAAMGEFVGLQIENITSNNDGLEEYALYAIFNSPTDNVLGVSHASIFTTTGFFHNTIAGGQQSALPFTSAQNALSDNPDADSFVTVGLFTGDGNGTILSPKFDQDECLFGDTLTDSAWFYFPPNSGQGIPDGQGRVLLAVFTPTNDLAGSAGVVSGNLTVGYSVGGPLPEFGVGSFITPAPGALGPLALAGVMGTRRRRET
jgi:hypothetical protein